MDKPPAPAWAIISFALKEKEMIPRWSARGPFYSILMMASESGVWYHHPDPVEDAWLWQAFQDNYNDWHGLTWFLSALATVLTSWTLPWR